MSEIINQLLRASVHRFIGRMARDPEIKFLPSGNTVCNARILINLPGAKRDDGQQPDGFDLTIWGDQAQLFCDSTHRGDLIDVSGRVKSESWTDRNTGEVRTKLVVTVDQWSLAGQPRQAAAPAAARPATPAPAAPAGGFAWASSDDSTIDAAIPF
jgi:single-strand DNA-binding protein